MVLPSTTSSHAAAVDPTDTQSPTSTINVNWFSSHQPMRLNRQSSYRTLMESWRGVQATFSKELQRPSVFGLCDAPSGQSSSSDNQKVVDIGVDVNDIFAVKGDCVSLPSPKSPCVENMANKIDNDYNQCGDDTISQSSSKDVMFNVAQSSNDGGSTKGGAQSHMIQQLCLQSTTSTDSYEQDFIPDDMHINIFELIFYACGVIGFFADNVTDIILCHAYYKINETGLFFFTLLCAIVPNIVLSLFSLAWHINEPRHYCSETRSISNNTQNFIGSNVNDDLSALNVFTWLCRLIILLLQLDLCFKYIRAFTYTYRGYCYGVRRNRKWEKYYLIKQIHIDADIALLRVFDVFMDSGTQVILQLYVLTSSPEKLCKMGIWNCGLNAKQILSIGCALLSLSYTIAGYNRCLRQLLLTRRRSSFSRTVEFAPMPVPFVSTAVNFMWCMLIIIPRVLALALFASVSVKGFWIFIFVHWSCMLLWIINSRTDFCLGSTASPHVDKTQQVPVHSSFQDLVENESKKGANRKSVLFERCYNFVCSYVYIFCYMNLKAGPTRMRYMVYYTIFYVENVALSIIYYKLYKIEPSKDHSITTRVSAKSYKSFMLCTIVIGFWLGLLIQLIYYVAFHPSKYVRKRLRVEWFRCSKRKQATCQDSSALHRLVGRSHDKFKDDNINSSINLMDLADLQACTSETQIQKQMTVAGVFTTNSMELVHDRPRSDSLPAFFKT